MTETATDIRWAEQPARAVQLLTVPEAAGRLSISTAKIWQLLRTARLRSVKIDRSRRIPEDAIEEYYASLRAEEAARRRERGVSKRAIARLRDST